MYKRLLLLLVLFLVFSFVSCSRESNVFKITHVVDGNSMVLDNGERIRLIGVDTPEEYIVSKLEEHDFFARAKEKDAKRFDKIKEDIKSMAIKANEFSKGLCEDKIIRVEYDRTKRDRYGRLFAYIYLPNGKLLNEEIILQGYGFYGDKYPFKQELMDRFKEAQSKAKSEQRGLWREYKEYYEVFP